MASFVYNSGKVKLINGSIDWDSDTMKLAFLTDSYSPNIDSDEFFDDVSGDEASGTGYTAGGVTLTTQATQDNAANRAIGDASNFQLTGLTLTFRYAVVYKSTGVASTSPLLLLIDLGDIIDVSAGTLDYTVPAEGMFYIG